MSLFKYIERTKAIHQLIETEKPAPVMNLPTELVSPGVY
jgi:hypothetical protein